MTKPVKKSQPLILGLIEKDILTAANEQQKESGVKTINLIELKKIFPYLSVLDLQNYLRPHGFKRFITERNG